MLDLAGSDVYVSCAFPRLSVLIYRPVLAVSLEMAVRSAVPALLNGVEVFIIAQQSQTESSAAFIDSVVQRFHGVWICEACCDQASILFLLYHVPHVVLYLSVHFNIDEGYICNSVRDDTACRRRCSF